MGIISEIGAGVKSVMALSDSTVCPGPTVFTTTRWSIVLTASNGEANAISALNTLCRTYWRPLYNFILRKGCQRHEAQDLTQQFFARLLEKDYLRSVDRNKGKFRSFLLGTLDHFLLNEWRRGKAQKRGGNVDFISFDDESAESEYSQLSANGLTSEKIYARQWALTLLEQVMTRLRNEFVSRGKEAMFEQLKVYLTRDESRCSYSELAQNLGTTPGAVKMAVKRMHERYGELLREEIRSTVRDEAEVEEELRELFAALSS